MDGRGLHGGWARHGEKTPQGLNRRIQKRKRKEKEKEKKRKRKRKIKRGRLFGRVAKVLGPVHTRVLSLSMVNSQQVTADYINNLLNSNVLTVFAVASSLCNKAIETLETLNK